MRQTGDPPTYRRGPLKAVWYWLTSSSIWVTAKTLYRLRTAGRGHVPMRGPVVIVANHQSHLDPPLVGGATRRQLSYLARDTLFRGPLAPLIRSYDAVPVDREGTGLAGIRATLKRLKQGGAVLLFPEGTRSTDGELQALKPGFIALVRRSGATLVTLGIDGSGNIWPKGAKRPNVTGRIAMHYAEPMAAEAIAGLDDERLLADVAAQLRAAVEAARALNDA